MQGKLRQARLAKRLSQQELAKLVGTSQPQIDRLEKGIRKLPLEWAARLAPHLDIKDPLDLVDVPAMESPVAESPRQQDPDNMPDVLAQLFETRSYLADKLEKSESDEERFDRASNIYRIDKTIFIGIRESRRGIPYRGYFVSEIKPEDFVPVLKVRLDLDRDLAFIDGTWEGITRRIDSAYGIEGVYALHVWDTNMLPAVPKGIVHVDPLASGDRDAPSVIRFKDKRALICTVRDISDEVVIISQLRPRGEMKIDPAEISEIHQIIGIDYNLMP